MNSTATRGAYHRQLLSRLVLQTKRMIRAIARQQPIHFLHIGKTGGSALKNVLQQYPIDSHYKLFLHAHHVTLRDIRPGEQVMFFLRDPISRFISGFFSRQRQGAPRYNSPWDSAEREAFETFHTPNSLGIAISSPDHDERARAHRAMKCILHVKSSYWDWFGSEDYFKSRASDIFFIGFQERLVEDFAILKARLGLPENASLPSDDITAHKNPSHVDKRLTDEAVANLKKWYAADYKFIALCEEIIRQHPRIRQCRIHASR